MDGYEATRQIRKWEMENCEQCKVLFEDSWSNPISGPIQVCPHDHVPVVAVTADVMSGTNEMCFTSGMDDYITKVLWIMIFCSKLTSWYAILISFFLLLVIIYKWRSGKKFAYSRICDEFACLLKNMWWTWYLMIVPFFSSFCGSHLTKSNCTCYWRGFSRKTWSMLQQQITVLHTRCNFILLWSH